jgi:hypothetical protein
VALAGRRIKRIVGDLIGDLVSTAASHWHTVAEVILGQTTYPIFF